MKDLRTTPGRVDSFRNAFLAGEDHGYHVAIQLCQGGSKSVNTLVYELMQERKLLAKRRAR